MTSVAQPAIGDNPQTELWDFPLHVPEQRKPVAGLTTQPDGSITLHKHVRDDAHEMTTWAAIGWNCGLLAEAQSYGAEAVRVTLRPSMRRLTTTIATILRYGRRRTFAGHGEQIFLPLDYWSINGAPPVNAGGLRHDQDPAPAAVQPALLDLAAVDAPRGKVYA